MYPTFKLADMSRLTSSGWSIFAAFDGVISPEVAFETVAAGYRTPMPRKRYELALLEVDGTDWYALCLKEKTPPVLGGA